MPMKMAEKALQESRSFGVRRIPVLRPLGWLARGWKDLMTSPVPGLLHGLAFAAGAALAIYIAGNKFWLLVGLFSAFLIVAPILATGLYQVSRRIAQGEQPGIETSMAAWKPKDGRLVVFGVLLGHVEAGAHGDRVARKLASALQQPLSVAGQSCSVSVSAGLALYPDHGKDAESLLRRASAQALSVATVGAEGFAARDERSHGAAANDEPT